MSRLTRDGTAELVSRDQILRRARGQGNIHFPCSADHEQDWQPYPGDPYSAICDVMTIVVLLGKYTRFQTSSSTYYCEDHQMLFVYHQLGQPKIGQVLKDQQLNNMVESTPSGYFLEKNLNAPRPSEHPPVRGENVKTFRWDNTLQRQNLFMAFKRVPRW